MNTSDESNVAPSVDGSTQDSTVERWLNRTVVGPGLTSALGDFGYETTTVILPGFLAVLGIAAAVLGTIEGIADAVASFANRIGLLVPH